LADRGGPDGLHGLDRQGRLEVKTHGNLEEPERNEHADRIHPSDGEIADHERDERPEVTERPAASRRL
jgi:hypothetical protein